MPKCVKITSFFFVLLFELLPDTTSTVSGDCDFLRSCVNYKYIEKKKKKKNTTLYSKCEQSFNLWQQLILASELKSVLPDIVDRGRNWFVDFNVGKTQLILFYRSNNSGAIDVKMHGSVLEEI